MSSTLIKNNDSSFWIHNAVAEVWLIALAKQIAGSQYDSKWLVDFAAEINEALAAGWVVGPLQYDFASALRDPKQIEIFKEIFEAVEVQLRDLATTDSVIKIDNYCASSEFMVRELEMLGNLFFAPSLVPSPPHIYTSEKGWKVA
jgi:hypothetical protein